MWDMCQMLNIWHISHTKHKNQLPSDVAYVPKLYHICPYHCKFATVWTDMVKPNNVLYLLLSLLSLPVLTLDFFSLSSHIRPKLPSTTQQTLFASLSPLTSGLDSWFLLSLFSHQTKASLNNSTEKEQNDTLIGSEEKQIIFMGEATPIGSSPSSLPSEAQVAWARPLRSSPLRSDHRHHHRRWRHKRHGRGHSDHPHRHRRHHRRSNLADLSFSLFWWLVVLIVGGWLILVDGGRLIGLWVWDFGWYWCLSLGWSGWLILVDRVLIVVFVWVFFFWVAVADIGGRWLICGGGRWLWAVAIDLQYGLLLLLLLLMIMGEGIIYYFNM